MSLLRVHQFCQTAELFDSGRVMLDKSILKLTALEIICSLCRLPNHMIACFDVHYFDTHANAAAVIIEDWSDSDCVEKLCIRCDAPKEYIAGEFYRRELDPLKTIIASIDSQIQTCVIDAYCHLSADGKPGLGSYLHNELSDGGSIIGVAKNPFRDTKHAIELMRGNSARPLFVTSIGIDYQTAAEHIKSMHGNHRIPTLLKMVDRLCRDGSDPP